MEPVPLKALAFPDSGNSSTPGPSRQAVNQQMVFDFTKRKRWGDLLVTELTEAIILVLSVTGQVWYCGPAIEELLGWRDEEIVDGDFCEIMNKHVRLQERVRLARERAESQSKPRQPPQSRYQPQSYPYPYQGHDGQHQDFERLFYSYGDETGDLPSGSVLPAVNSGANQNSGQGEADLDDQNLSRKKVGVLIFCVCQ
ncbi:hypothetical protein PHLCEN_2v5834 [Hermanssonia centrifuga]|uniref:PAS domain-containing protein n=1 Tax=Hermanssonia centrifuga TaxID=98765 RepID=A0A2R6P112_9APHY|nr:hypothetical protein PHLCEN_2v5834 [Hermanssonia centrifuga]